MNRRGHILIKFIITGFISVIAIDYLNFDLNISNSNIVYGNSLVPKNVVISHIEDKDKIDKDIFSSIIGDLKILQVSNNQRLILIKENMPQFYDDSNIYLSSGIKVQYRQYPNFKSLFNKILIPKFESRSNVDISENILDLIKLLNDNNNPLLEKLSYIELTENNRLSMQSGNCEIVLLDNVSNNNKKQISKKIKILNEFIYQSKENLDNIENIDLRWDDRVFIKTI
tara:strand:- start:814 stop:1494 length:681 start_codon:yes stop_codon:yes gene_type:complete